MGDLIEGEQYLALCCGTWHLVVCRGGRLGFDSADRAGFHALNDVKRYHRLRDLLVACETLAAPPVHPQSPATFGKER